MSISRLLSHLCIQQYNYWNLTFSNSSFSTLHIWVNTDNRVSMGVCCVLGINCDRKGFRNSCDSLLIDQICYWLQKRIFNADFPVRSAQKLIGFSKCVPFHPFCSPFFQKKRSLCAPFFDEETFIFVSKFLLRVISFFLPKLLRSFFAIRLLVLFCPAPVCLWQLWETFANNNNDENTSIW